jgi:uncharacterized protein
MKKGLLQLLELQEVDKELQMLEEAKDKYPDEIGSLQQELERAGQRLAEQDKLLADLAKQQRQLERECEDAKIDLKKHEERFAEVTTNKEYDALQLEIEACKAKIAECETRILETIDRIDALRVQVETERRTFDENRQAQQERLDELKAKLATSQQEIEGVSAQRQHLVAQIEPYPLRVYERSRKRKGTRVAAVRKGACGGCFRELPAQQRSNVRRNEQIYYCESCGVILLWDETSN